MQVKKLLIMLIAAIVMILAFRMGVTGDKLAEKEQFFTKQIFHEDMVYNETNVNLIGESVHTDVFNEEVIVVVVVSALVSFFICVLFAKKTGLFFVTEKSKRVKKADDNVNIEELLKVNLLDSSYNSKSKIHTIEMQIEIEPSTEGIAV